MNVSAFRLTCAAFGLLALAVFFLGASPAGTEKKVGVLRIDESSVYSLNNLAKLMRDKADVEAYVDSRHGERRLFVSKGAYPVDELLGSIRIATGLQLRKVDKVFFLTGTDATLGDKLLFPALPRRLLDELGKHLKPIAESTDTRKEGIPWLPREFLEQSTFDYRELPLAKQVFILRIVNDIRPYAFSVSTFDYRLIEKEGMRRLAKAKIRLGTSYLLGLSVYKPSNREGERDKHAKADEIIQVYYDYRDRLGAGLPDE